jgi:hypothetical protein
MAPLNVTPMTLSEMVKTLLDDPAQKDQIGQLQQAYATGSIAKDDFTGMLGQICGADTMTKALRIMVPGYDEMCGHAPAPQAALPPAPAPAPAAPATAPNLKKGFFASGSIAPKGGDAPYVQPLPKPKEVGATLDGVDVVSMREHYYQHMQEAVPRMQPEHRDHLLHNNFVMHDAKSAANGGNVVLGKDGRAKVLSDDSMGGVAARYTWGQNESEVTIKVGGLPKGTKAKDVNLSTTSVAIKLHIGGEQICTGALHKPILADESTFIIEDEKAAVSAGEGASAAGGDGGGSAGSGGSGTRLVIVTLTKREPTGGKSHWPCVVEGDDGRIDPSTFGVQTLVADPNKPHEFVEAMKHLEVS